ncbi:DMT family transporter [Fluviicola sp.]|jgi:drug/metabolite transporter (DMT)-like permease|uniref:EamA family transporter n=1 Tax=Fluviicola sp. TaxID=1917219 RepID=UPI0028211715|nr:DMT family transporter [Fluviicola sp.]MDR0803300.1 DMT family transporter [Fluviicola sp.]
MSKLKGAFLVGFGAASYGILATIVKFANNSGAHTSVLTFYQALVGVVSLFILMTIQYRRQPDLMRPKTKSKVKLVLFGISMGLTSCLYYISIQYVSVSTGIILLMQSIWMSVVWEMVQQRKPAHWSKLLGSLTVLAGTVFATNLIQQDMKLSTTGILYGLAAALSYTVSLHASNHVEKQIPSITRSFYLILGSWFTVTAFWNIQIPPNLDWMILLKFGLVLGIFGTVIPPVMFTRGIPLTGLGLAGILVALEIPVSILSARFVLKEHISLIQWLGVALILLTVIFMNSRKKNH